MAAEEHIHRLCHLDSTETLVRGDERRRYDDRNLVYPSLLVGGMGSGHHLDLECYKQVSDPFRV